MGAMSLGASSPFIESFGIAKGAAAKVFQIIETKPLIDPLANTGDVPKSCEGNITLRNVFFNYPSRPNVKVLQGINLSINKGETVALVGSSGCGKSTCIQLIQRFYDPDQGDVMSIVTDVGESFSCFSGLRFYWTIATSESSTLIGFVKKSVSLVRSRYFSARQFLKIFATDTSMQLFKTLKKRRGQPMLIISFIDCLRVTTRWLVSEGLKCLAVRSNVLLSLVHWFETQVSFWEWTTECYK